jgi:Uma2 family endonuclease
METGFIEPLLCKGTSYEGAIPKTLTPNKWAHLEQIITEDDTPVDNIPSSKQQRLLVESLYSSWGGSKKTRKFLVDANIGIFYDPEESGIVPDVFLSLDVSVAKDWWQKKNRSYFTHIFGKVPEVVIEIVSNKEGHEDGSKLQKYAQLKIPHYVIFDPQELLTFETLRIYKLVSNQYVKQENPWLAKAGLGLTFWEGVYEDQEGVWLRWRNRNGNLILTGAERAEREHQRAEEERQQKELAVKKAEEERQQKDLAVKKAEEERQQKDLAVKKAEQADKRAEYLAAKLRALGINPDQL